MRISDDKMNEIVKEVVGEVTSNYEIGEIWNGLDEPYKEDVENKVFGIIKNGINNEEFGSISDEELSEWGFTENQKEIIKKMYATHKKGTFPNPRCALY